VREGRLEGAIGIGDEVADDWVGLGLIEESGVGSAPSSWGIAEVVSFAIADSFALRGGGVEGVGDERVSWACWR
jgi:hypothetical protein